MRTYNIPLYHKIWKIYPFMPPDLALLLTLISSNYPCLEHIFMVPIEVLLYIVTHYNIILGIMSLCHGSTETQL